jgi:hypothetical protein
MPLASPLRKAVLTAHIATSVGWIGAVAAFLVLAVEGLAGSTEPSIRAAYVAMDLTTWYAIVPLAVSSFVTGVISSVGTAWGLFRHYWVLLKLLITLLATGVLIIHLQPIERLAAAATTGMPGPDLYQARTLMVFASSAAIIAILVLITLSVYKPRGMTPYGWRRQQAEARG